MRLKALKLHRNLFVLFYKCKKEAKKIVALAESNEIFISKFSFRMKSEGKNKKLMQEIKKNESCFLYLFSWV
jgi:hypothetical protein